MKRIILTFTLCLFAASSGCSDSKESKYESQLDSMTPLLNDFESNRKSGMSDRDAYGRAKESTGKDVTFD